MPPGFKPYAGSLGRNLPRRVLRGYHVWRNQLRRCTDPRNTAYPTYGAKGIRVEYTVREFLGWYLSQRKLLRSGRWHVGRLDHAKNYCFANIAVQTASENCREMIERCGAPCAKLSFAVAEKIRIALGKRKPRSTRRRAVGWEYGAVTRLAKKYGVSVTTIGDIGHGRIWRGEKTRVPSKRKSTGRAAKDAQHLGN